MTPRPPPPQVVTPWGLSDSAQPIADGLVFYATPRHGGYYVAPARVASMPKPLCDFQPWAGPNWYEEDCDWCIVALAFPQFFPAVAIPLALATLKRYQPALFDEVAALRERGG